MSKDAITLDSEAATAIREALIIGLRCYGETLRIRSYSDALEAEGRKLPDEAIPAFSETSSTACLFADAFAYLNM